jgi:hypothetical protein
MQRLQKRYFWGDNIRPALDFRKLSPIIRTIFVILMIQIGSTNGIELLVYAAGIVTPSA